MGCRRADAALRRRQRVVQVLARAIEPPSRFIRYGARRKLGPNVCGNRVERPPRLEQFVEHTQAPLDRFNLALCPP
jgi:hypothetical protein